MPTPTVGRIMHYYPRGANHYDAPLVAIVVKVFPGTNVVNLAYYDSEGWQGRAPSIPWIDDNEPSPNYTAFCCYPPMGATMNLLCD